MCVICLSLHGFNSSVQPYILINGGGGARFNLKCCFTYSFFPVRIKWPSGNVYTGKLLYRNFISPAFDLAFLSVKVKESDRPSTLQTSKVKEG